MSDVESTTPADREAAHALVARWVAPWNGDLSAADEIISEDNRVHTAMFDGGDGDTAG